MPYTLDWARASHSPMERLDSQILTMFATGAPRAPNEAPELQTWVAAWALVKDCPTGGLARFCSTQADELLALATDLQEQRAEIAAGFAHWRRSTLDSSLEALKAAEVALEASAKLDCPALRALAMVEAGRLRRAGPPELVEAREIIIGEGQLLAAWLLQAEARIFEARSEYEKAETAWHGAARHFRRLALERVSLECSYRRSYALLECNHAAQGIAVLESLPAPPLDLRPEFFRTRALLSLSLGRARDALADLEALRAHSLHEGTPEAWDACRLLGLPPPAPPPADAPELELLRWRIRTSDDIRFKEWIPTAPPTIACEAALVWAQRAATNGHSDDQIQAFRLASVHASTPRWRYAVFRARALTAARQGDPTDVARLLAESELLGDLHGQVQARLQRARNADDKFGDLATVEKIATEQGYPDALVELRLLSQAFERPIHGPTATERCDLLALEAAVRFSKSSDQGDYSALCALEQHLNRVPYPERQPLRAFLSRILAKSSTKHLAGEGSPILLLHHPTSSVWLDGRRIAQLNRSPLQFRLLSALADGGPTDRESLFLRVWERKYLPPSSDNSLYVAINRLRTVLESTGLAVAAVADGYRITVGATYQISDATALPVSTKEAEPTTPITNLAAPGVRLHGRESTIARVRAQMANSSVVSILGMGGAGKTCIAHELAWRSLNEHSFREVWWVDLYKTTATLGLTILRALGVPPSGDIDAQVSRTLARRGATLLVLDHAEALSTEGKLSLARWRSEAPETRYLITTRERLWIPDEQVVALEAMPAESAIALFVERARSAGGTVDPADPDLLNLLARLDFLPLGIELTAARAAFLSLPALTERLHTRNSPLRAAFTASWEGLTDQEKTVLSACSVFFGGFDTEAAEAVVGLPQATIIEVLRALKDKSLLRKSEALTENPRYEMFQIVSAYAAEHLTPDATENFRGRHAAFFAAHAANFANLLYGPNSHSTLRLLHFDRGNFETALTSSFPKDPQNAFKLGVLLSKQAITEHTLPRFELIQRLFSLEHLMPEETRHELVHNRGVCLYFLGKYEDAASDFRRVIRESTSDTMLSITWGSLATLLSRLDPEAAVDARDRAVAHGRASGKPYVEARAITSHAHRTSSLHEWRAAAEQGAAMAQAFGFLDLEISNLNNLFGTLTHLDDPTTTLNAFIRAESITRHDIRQRSLLLLNAGLFLHWLGRHEEAIAHLRESLRGNHDTGNRRLEAAGLQCLGIIATDLMRPAEAASHFAAALELQRPLNSPDQNGTLAWWGCLDLDQGRLREAQHKLEQNTSKTHVHYSFLRGHRGSVAHAVGDLDTARTHYQEALSEIQAGEVPHWRSFFFARLAAIHWGRGELEVGDTLYVQARQLAEKSTFADAIAAVTLWGSFRNLDRRKDMDARISAVLSTANGLSFAQRSSEIRFALRLLDDALSA